MSNIKKSVYKSIKTNLFMKRDFKSQLVDKNLKHILFIAPVLMLFSATLLSITFIRRYPYYQQNLMEFLYYGIMFLLSTTGFCLALFFRKRKNYNPLIRNIPLFLLFFGFLILCYEVFLYGPNKFNAFLVFLCVVTITPLVFAIEPLVYNPLLIAFYISISSKIQNQYGSGSSINVLLFIMILFFLALIRWRSLMHKMKHEYLAHEHENVLQRELEMASMVQKSFYTHDLSKIKDWDVVYRNEPMMSLSGDLFDFFVRQDKLSGLCIFDVSGHGLSSGLITMMVKNAMEEEFYENEDVELGFTMQRINTRVRKEKGNIENYLTGIMLKLNENNIELVNAGHPVPIIYRDDEKKADYMECSFEDRQGVIGLGDLDFFFNTLTVDFKPNDRIILYTDGITEAKNKFDEQYGKERFLQSVQAHSELDCQEQMEEVLKDVKAFIGSAPRSDDISMIILKKK